MPLRLLVVSVVHGIGDELGDSATALEQAFIAVAFSMLGMAAAAFAISLTLRLNQEEASQRAETLLADAVGRTRWLASHLVIALTGSAVAMLVAGLAAGLAYGIARPRHRRQAGDGCRQRRSAAPPGCSPRRRSDC